MPNTELLMTDPLKWKAEAEAELLKTHGPEWMKEHAGHLEAEFLYIVELFGDPAKLPKAKPAAE